MQKQKLLRGILLAMAVATIYAWLICGFIAVHSMEEYRNADWVRDVAEIAPTLSQPTVAESLIGNILHIIPNVIPTLAVWICCMAALIAWYACITRAARLEKLAGPLQERTGFRRHLDGSL